MRDLRTVGAALVVAVATAGCGNRPPGPCALAGGLIGATLGGVGGGVGTFNIGKDPNNGEVAGGAAAGLVAGGLIGAIAGHYICDPEEAPPPPPPSPPPPPPPARKPIVTLHGPQFDFDKATLKPAGKQLLDQAVKVMQEQPSLRVSVEGHTDSIGSDAYNQKLSERRAAAVRDYLVSQGIDAARITARGFGKARPVASNQTAEGRAENRRVEILPAQ